MIPALKRGLEVLKIILLSDTPLAYHEIATRTGIPTTSVSRLLKSLEEGGYILKDSQSGKYRAGQELLVMGHGAPPFERLLTNSREVLRSLSAYTSNTALLVFWNGRDIQCIDKVVEPFSISMQDLGTITRDCSHMPWGWFFYETLDEADRKVARGEMKDPKAFLSKLPRRLAQYHGEGVAVDDGEFYDHVRRVAAPVWDHGHIVGAVVVGGNTLTLPDAAMERTKKEVKRAARGLSLGTMGS